MAAIVFIGRLAPAANADDGPFERTVKIIERSELSRRLLTAERQAERALETERQALEKSADAAGSAEGYGQIMKKITEIDRKAVDLRASTDAKLPKRTVEQEAADRATLAKGVQALQRIVRGATETLAGLPGKYSEAGLLAAIELLRRAQAATDKSLSVRLPDGKIALAPEAAQLALMRKAADQAAQNYLLIADARRKTDAAMSPESKTILDDRIGIARKEFAALAESVRFMEWMRDARTGKGTPADAAIMQAADAGIRSALAGPDYAGAKIRPSKAVADPASDPLNNYWGTKFFLQPQAPVMNPELAPMIQYGLMPVPALPGAISAPAGQTPLRLR